MQQNSSRLYVLLIFLLVPLACIGQEDRSMLQLNFARQNDFTFSTSLQNRILVEKGKYELDFLLGHSNIFNLSLENDRFVQLYLQSSIWQHYNLNDKVAAASWIETNQYFDSRNEKVALYGGLRYRPTAGLTLTPLIGYTWDVRTAILGRSEPFIRVDQGFTPALIALYQRSWPEEKLAVDTRVFLRYKNIAPRQQRNLVFFQSWTKKFEEGVQIEVRGRAGSHELDDYQSNSVKRIISDTLNPEFFMSYTFFPGMEWRSENSFLINRRAFRFQNVAGPDPEENDLVFDGFELASNQRLSYATPKWRTYAAYRYVFSSRKYQLENDLGLNEQDFMAQLDREKEKDYVKNLHNLEFFARRQLDRKQSLALRLVNQYLQYDSPSEINYDDRDELSWVGSIEWQKGWRSNFSTTTGLSANYRHYAFLYGEKSQDNYVQRTLRLDFGYAWNVTPLFRLEGNNGIYVTYNVKDFTDYNKTDRATRNLETNFRAIYRPNRKYTFEASMKRKETHQSYLDWERFTETTLDTNRLNTQEILVRRTLSTNKRSQWNLELGYKHFKQFRKFKASMVGLDNLVQAISLRQISLQTGPRISIGYRDRRQSSVDLGLWFQIQVRKNRFETLPGTQVFGSAYFESELREVSTEVRPYPTVRINYFFN